MRLAASIPRFVDEAQFRADPLSFLRALQQTVGDVAVVSGDGSLFSRAHNCSGTIAVFGAKCLREVLTDPSVFGMPISGGDRFSLPPKLVRLNAGLASMVGVQHRTRQRLFTRLMEPTAVRTCAESITRGWESFQKDLRIGEDVPLFSEMRRLTRTISQRTIFGDESSELGQLIQSYFDLRRAFTATRGRGEVDCRRQLVRAGTHLHALLESRLESIRGASLRESNAPTCLFARLSKLQLGSGDCLPDDELLAHGNVLFMSSSEPVAAALTWTLLLLSQFPHLRNAVRSELKKEFHGGTVPNYFDSKNLPLLNGILKESLRLLPPNAIMVRLTTRRARILGHELPPQTEILLSSFVAHRDLRDYEEPDAFDPVRWQKLNPSPYAYFPFSVGARYCPGAELARFTIASVLAQIFLHYDVVLATDQAVDWKMDITMMPASDPLARFYPLSSFGSALTGGLLLGPVADLLANASPS
jgi:cytochrome P450